MILNFKLSLEKFFFSMEPSTKTPTKTTTPPKTTASKYANRGKRWTDTDRSLMTEWLTNGKSFKEISAHLGRTEKAVQLEFAKHVKEKQKENPTYSQEFLANYFEVDESLIAKALQTDFSKDAKSESSKASTDLVSALKELNESNKKVIKLLEENSSLKDKIFKLTEDNLILKDKIAKMTEENADLQERINELEDFGK